MHEYVGTLEIYCLYYENLYMKFDDIPSISIEANALKNPLCFISYTNNYS